MCRLWFGYEMPTKGGMWKAHSKKVDPTIERIAWLAHKDSDLDPPCMDYWEIVETEEGVPDQRKWVTGDMSLVATTADSPLLPLCLLTFFLFLLLPFPSLPSSFSVCPSLSFPLLPSAPPPFLGFWDHLTKQSKQANKNHTLGLNQSLWLLIFIDNQAGFRIILDTPLGASLRVFQEKV